MPPSKRSRTDDKENANDATKLLARFDPGKVAAAANSDKALRQRLLRFAESLKKELEVADSVRRKTEGERALESGECLKCGNVEEDDCNVYRCKCFEATNGADGLQACEDCYNDGDVHGPFFSECSECSLLSCNKPSCPTIIECPDDNCDQRACRDCSGGWVPSACGALWCGECAEEATRCATCKKLLCGPVGEIIKKMARDGCCDAHPCGEDECAYCFCDECDEPVCLECKTERRFDGRTLHVCEPCGSYYEDF